MDASAGPMRIVWGSEDRLLPMRGYSERWRRLLPTPSGSSSRAQGTCRCSTTPTRVAELILEVTTLRPDRRRARKAPTTLLADLPSALAARRCGRLRGREAAALDRAYAAKGP